MCENIMQDTIHQNGMHIEKINEVKHERADQCLRRQKVRKTNQAMIDMLKILKALRTKQEVLRENVKFMRAKRSVQKWFTRSQVTIYLRRRDQQVLDKYKKKRLSQLMEAWKDNMRDETKAN